MSRQQIRNWKKELARTTNVLQRKHLKTKISDAESEVKDMEDESTESCAGIHIIQLQSNVSVKGIDLDAEILYHNIKHCCTNDVNFVSMKSNFTPVVPLSKKTIIFIEILPTRRLLQGLLEKGKVIVWKPNIDSFPRSEQVYHKEQSLIMVLKTFSSYSNFHIWCKTSQTFQWLHKYSIPRLHRIHFVNNIEQYIAANDQKTWTLPPRENCILLDSGSSRTGRKYLKEIVSLFHKHPGLPYHLVVKTTSFLYQKHLKKMLGQQKKLPNITIVDQIIPLSRLNHLYDQCAWCVYLSRHDAFGLTLSKAMRHGLFIFVLEGEPWKEILEGYPAKCFIKATKIGQKGAQHMYDADLNDLLKKLRCHNQHKKILQKNQDLIHAFNEQQDEEFHKSLRSFFAKK